MPDPDTSNGLPVSGGSEKDGSNGRTGHWHGDSPGVVTPIRAKRRNKMTTREEMISLAEDIVGSYADRIAGIAELRETVKMDLRGFQDSRTAMAKELRTELTKSVGDRKVAISAQLKELDAAHAAMSREMRAELTKGRQALAKGESERQSEAREFMGELGKAVAQGKAAVKTLLGEFDSSHNAMSREMRAELTKGRQALAKGESERQSEAREFIGELGRTVAEGKAATQAQLKQLAEVQAGARDEWQILTATMQAQRVGAMVDLEPPEAVAVPAKEIAEEEAAEITPETTTLRDRVFKYLANHPDGTKMTELEQEFGVARIKMARVIRSLLDENKVEKQELHYFAI